MEKDFFYNVSGREEEKDTGPTSPLAPDYGL